MSEPRTLVASVVTMLVLLTSSTSAQNAMALQSTSMLTVTVQYVAISGVQPSRELGQLDPNRRRSVESPAPGVAVRAVLADTSPTTPVASATTDETGHATFTLPAGSYLVVVPTAPNDFPGLWRAVITRQLPDGTLVSGVQSVDLAPGATGDVTISLVAPMP